MLKSELDKSEHELDRSEFKQSRNEIRVGKTRRKRGYVDSRKRTQGQGQTRINQEQACSDDDEEFGGSDVGRSMTSEEG